MFSSTACLQEFTVLNEKYADQGLVIMAFPCNQFGWQVSERPNVDGGQSCSSPSSQHQLVLAL